MPVLGVKLRAVFEAPRNEDAGAVDVLGALRELLPAPPPEAPATESLQDALRTRYAQDDDIFQGDKLEALAKSAASVVVVALILGADPTGACTPATRAADEVRLSLCHPVYDEFAKQHHISLTPNPFAGT